MRGGRASVVEVRDRKVRLLGWAAVSISRRYRTHMELGTALRLLDWKTTPFASSNAAGWSTKSRRACLRGGRAAARAECPRRATGGSVLPRAKPDQRSAVPAFPVCTAPAHRDR